VVSNGNMLLVLTSFSLRITLAVKVGAYSCHHLGHWWQAFTLGQAQFYALCTKVRRGLMSWFATWILYWLACQQIHVRCPYGLSFLNFREEMMAEPVRTIGGLNELTHVHC
jgi:hypothetical protein